jgi:hypothetical protein
VKLKPPIGVGREPIIRSAGNVYTRVTKRGLVVEKWPRSSRPTTDTAIFNRTQMKVAADMIKYAVPADVESARNFQVGSNDTWKDILMRAQFGTLFKVIAPDGTIATVANHGYVPPVPTGGDHVPWSLIQEYDIAVSGPTSLIKVLATDTYDEILIAMVQVTRSASATSQVRCSTNGGTTFFGTLGNYKAMLVNSREGDQTGFFFHTNLTVALQTSYMLIQLMRIGKKYCRGVAAAGQNLNYRFVANDSPVNALGIVPSSGTFNAGHFGVFAR